ncbi:MAG: hypothetical protein ACFFE4_06675 [Candidatus Thorarchaeota archaeon]
MRKYKPISLIIILILLPGFVPTQKSNDYLKKNPNLPNIDLTQGSINSTLKIIEEIFNGKLSFYENYGFFPQGYKSSLQATYYSLSILKSLGKIDRINTSAIRNYILSYYNSSTGIFMDNYASRYLYTDFGYGYYTLSTLLEVNCYALLSLSLLGSLNLVNIGTSIDFLWSCYNPVTSGFIGQPYQAGLKQEFKISTMDNTYFAIITLDQLMGSSWSGFSEEKDDLIAYINSLQYLTSGGWQYGGFYNDVNSSFDSLGLLFEPNLLSSFYSIKSLQIFGMVSSINDTAFHQFLDALYDSSEGYFRISQFDFSNNYTNIVATAVGLELSDITNYPSIDILGVLSFLYNNRNDAGLWDGSTSIKNYELIDTFQILRSISNTGEINIFNINDVEQVVESLLLQFSSYEGFSLIPKEYTLIDCIFTIIKSFDLFDKISELDLQGLYYAISNSYYYDDYLGKDGFISYLVDDKLNYFFRSYPLDFYSMGSKDNFGYLISHKATYQALDALRMMFKLDDFALTTPLLRLLENIVDTQFINTLYPDHHGAFLPIDEYDPNWADIQSKKIFLEYSFYAIRCFELISEKLGIGDLTFIDFNITALNNFILHHVVETSEIIYYLPSYSNDMDNIIQNTYYMIYILIALDLYSLPTSKIENLIVQYIDYKNIKNFYYCYKINEILDLGLEFKRDELQALIHSIYNYPLHEFYVDTTKTVIDQSIFLWICDIAKNDPLVIEANYDNPIILGTHLVITASLSNLVLSNFEYNLSFEFVSPQLGYYRMVKEDYNLFSLDLYVPHRAVNYPSIEIKLVAYDTNNQLVERFIIINTLFNQKYYNNEISAAVVLSALFLTIPGGFVLISGKKRKHFT